MTPRSTLAVVVAFTAGIVIGASTLAPAAQQAREYYFARSQGDPEVTPFSGGVRAGDTVYLSGTLGLGPGRQRPATAEQEATNVLNNVRRQLGAANLTMDDLVSVQVFASDPADYDAFNRVYRTFFTQEFPARAFVGAGPLLFGARFEVQGIAVRR